MKVRINRPRAVFLGILLVAAITGSLGIVGHPLPLQVFCTLVGVVLFVVWFQGTWEILGEP